MAAHHHRLRPPPQPSPRLVRAVSVPAMPPPRLLPRPLLASLQPAAPPRSLPGKRGSDPVKANRETAAPVFGVEETGEREVAREDAEEGYVASVGAGECPAGLPEHLRAARAGLGDPVFFLLAFVAVATSAAFTSMVAVAIPTMLAMRRAANSFTLLTDAALEELPSTMAAVRLSGMEISDLTLELSDLSQEIADGVNKSAKVAQAVEAGLGQMRDLAQQQATSMIEERTNLQTIPNAAKKSNGSSTRQRRQEKGPFTR
ncbi:hypothetical protein E2562_005634 [Oryza meyeriana var. granulata]|uniref:Uncharacterized protein n=1 Tax=Oryza meyeriana var. granulata TaxID=110450 RepID=A0A6G1BIU3_9ORYZ|nr:hypothetical protein E2562_005634 [Oryza meyeriana var. granulata]